MLFLVVLLGFYAIVVTYLIFKEVGRADELMSERDMTRRQRDEAREEAAIHRDKIRELEGIIARSEELMQEYDAAIDACVKLRGE